MSVDPKVLWINTAASVVTSIVLLLIAGVVAYCASMVTLTEGDGFSFRAVVRYFFPVPTGT